MPSPYPSIENNRTCLGRVANISLTYLPTLDSLLMVASQCEDLGGHGVNLARGALASEGLLIWEDPGCGSAKRSSVESDSSFTDAVFKAELWPNPADGLIQIRFDEPRNWDRIEAWDAYGKLLYTTAIDAHNPITIKADGWVQGMVIVNAFTKAGHAKRWKVTILR